jgi:hypothetical protein
VVKGMVTNIKFGMELEANFIGKRGIVRHVYSPYACPQGWGYQSDPTAGTELRTPVLKTVKEGLKEIQKLKFWSERNNGVALHFKGNRYYSRIGGHIHISIWNGGSNVTSERLIDTVTKVYRILPFCYFINANGYFNGALSRRMAYHPYSPYIDSYHRLTDEYHLREYRDEVHHNREYNTIEFRMFDANVPIIQLTVFWLIREAIVNKVNNITAEDFEILRRVRQNILRYPYHFEYLLLARQQFSSIDDDIRYKEIKNILALSFSYLTNFAKFAENYNYDFSSKAMIGDIELKLRGYKAKVWNDITNINVKRFKEIYRRIVITPENYIISKLQGFNIDNINDVNVEIAENTMRIGDEILSLFNGVEVINLDSGMIRRFYKEAGLTRRDIEQLFRSKLSAWRRLNELSLEQLNKVVEVTGMQSKQLYDLEERVYTLVSGNEILGVIFFLMSDASITNVFPINVSKEKLLENFIKFIKSKEGFREVNVNV